MVFCFPRLFILLFHRQLRTVHTVDQPTGLWNIIPVSIYSCSDLSQFIYLEGKGSRYIMDDSVDPNYEYFDAPKQVDFHELMNGDDSKSDNWFGKYF